MAAPIPCTVYPTVPFVGIGSWIKTISSCAPSYWSQTLRSAYRGLLALARITVVVAGLLSLGRL